MLPDQPVSPRSAEVPRYSRVSSILAGRIEQGLYKVGDLLPTEVELCEEFEISRFTVREALRRLAEAGLVRRRQGSGTQIIAARSQPNYVHTMRSLSELFQYAADTRLVIDLIDDRAPDSALASEMGLDAGGQECLYFEGMRYDPDGTPICFTEVHVNAEFAGIRTDLEGNSGAVYALIERRYQVSIEDVAQEIRVTPVQREIARRLGIKANSMVVRIARRYLDSDGRLIQFSVNQHPCERFSYAMHLRREAGKGFS